MDRPAAEGAAAAADGPSTRVAAAARRFRTEHGPLGPDAETSPTETLAWLARVIDRFASRDVSPQIEGEFVDGAGATLARVLEVALRRADARVASRDGVTRLLLGHGAFDPFAAIARALDGPSAKAVLVAEVGRAEAEAAGHGPIARVALALDRALESRELPHRVVERFDRRVWLADGTEIDLGRAIDATEDQGLAAVEAAAEKIVSMLAGAPPLAREEALARVVPRLVGPSFDVPAALVLLPGPADIRIGLVVPMGARARYVSPADLARWSLAPDAVLPRAIANLAERSARARFARVDTAEGPLVFARSGDGLDAARLLLPALFETLAPELGGPFLAAVPHRDVLWCAADTPPLRAALKARVDDDHARAPHAISRTIVTVHPSPGA